MTETLIGAIIAILTGSGGVFWLLSTIINKRLDKQTKATEEQTLQSSMVGKLRVALERLDNKTADAHHTFLIALAEAYARGNDREKIAAMTKTMKDQRSEFGDVEEELHEAITAVYDGKITEAEVNELSARVKKLKVTRR